MTSRLLVRLAVASLIVLGLGAGAGWWWLQKQAFETTDNAYVEADTISVSPQIDGYVADILVHDNEAVSPGQVLVRLDPTDAKTRLDQALAAAAAARAAVSSVDDRSSLEQAMIQEKLAALSSAEAAARRASADLDRYTALAGRGFATAQHLQETKAASDQSSAAVDQAKAALEAERRSAASLTSTRSQSLAEVEAAEAAVEKARIDLERTVIRAPAAGVIGARSVRPGQYVRPGGAIMAIVPLGETYIVANFKETQVSRLRIGQPVEIRADAFGGDVIKGHVDSFAPATGSEFALIPVENAVGNFTKIAQRLPVRIALERDSPMAGALRPGLSVRVKVDVKSQTGASFAEALPPARVAADDAPAAE